MAEAVIETTGLRKRFGAKTAVEDLSLVVRRGEVFGFLGPNGAGKTTSLKMLLGLIAPTAGRGAVLGRPLGDVAARARLGFLPEHFRFHEWLTGRELLAVHGALLGLGGRALDRRIEALLARVGLVDAAARPLKGYSKGMLQRIGLAQALLAEPEVVFLDEPTSGLDPLGRLLVRDLIRELRAGGTTVFLNSHLLGEVEATCDRVVFVKQGRTVHEMRLGDDAGGLDVELRLGGADAATLEGLGRHGERLEILGAAGGEPGAAAAGDAPGAGAPGNGLRVRLRVDGEARLPDIAAWLVGRGARLYEMRAARKSLEAWFLEVMGADQRPG
uniref:ABC transporter ATP-binding protein n=1 Tax=Eiseniibacteriota bacterium TaxID=2212470 RepID=A0A832I2X8_UNCEI